MGAFKFTDLLPDAAPPDPAKDNASVAAEASQEPNVKKSAPSIAPDEVACKPGATRADWDHFCGLGLTEDLLPVVSDLSAPISPDSGLDSSRIGKVPSRLNARGQVVGWATWTQHRATAEDVAKWARQGELGICVQTRQLRAIDVDITDPALAARVRDVLEDYFLANVPRRLRANSSKFLVPVWAESPKRLVKKRKFQVGDGDAIELLGDGQQFVAVGTHPSGTRYSWVGGLPTVFPRLTVEQLEELWGQLEEAFATATAPSTAAAPAAADRELERAYTLGRIDDTVLAELDDALTKFTAEYADDYNGWTNIGHALKTVAQAGHEEWAHERWHRFSALSARYDPDESETKWESFSPDRITYLTLFQEAQKLGWANPRRATLETEQERSVRIGREGEYRAPEQRVMSGSEMLEELVFIADGARVSFLREPRFVLPFPEFKRFAAASVDEVKSTDGKRTRKVARADLWLESPERKTVRTQTFAPGRPPICTSPDNVEALNLWVPRRGDPPANWAELSAPFFGHVAYLVPVPAERERFLDWLAHIEQAPGVLPSTHYLLVARQTGIGRNWLAYALARVWAGHVALGFDLGETLRSGFNGALSQTLLAVVDELHEGGPGGTNRPQAEKLKSLLTEATRRINPKYGRQHVEFNACRFLMFSNHVTALPLADNDRRVVVIENPEERRDPSYYKNLYALLDEPALGPALAEAFRRRDISRFNPGEIAPMNDAKRRTIRAGRTEVEQAVRDIAAEWAADVITSSRLQVEVGASLGIKAPSIQGAARAAGLVKYDRRVKVHGAAHHLWILRREQVWAGAPPAEIAAEAMRAEEVPAAL